MSKTLLIERWLEPDPDDRITTRDLYVASMEAMQRIEALAAERDMYESAATKALNERDRLREALEEIFNQPELNPQYDALEWYGQAQLIAKAALEDNQ